MWEVLALDQEVLSNDEIKKGRIILDHIRASVFIVSDGVEPANKDRGYVLRRLLRRALVMGRLLNLKHHWLEALMGKVVSAYAEAYPELVKNSNEIFRIILDEQKKFEATLEKGLKQLELRIKNSELGISGKDQN
jgi:alanyl-tRNA synthetase